MGKIILLAFMIQELSMQRIDCISLVFKENPSSLHISEKIAIAKAPLVMSGYLTACAIDFKKSIICCNERTYLIAPMAIASLGIPKMRLDS